MRNYLFLIHVAERVLDEIRDCLCYAMDNQIVFFFNRHLNIILQSNSLRWTVAILRNNICFLPPGACDYSCYTEIMFEISDLKIIYMLTSTVTLLTLIIM